MVTVAFSPKPETLEAYSVELYFKHQYKVFNYRIGKLTEYFVFPDVKPILNDLYGM
jgi:UPF0288 family protein (methanogenesis marker protein 3)